MHNEKFSYISLYLFSGLGRGVVGEFPEIISSNSTFLAQLNK